MNKHHLWVTLAILLLGITFSTSPQAVVQQESFQFTITVPLEFSNLDQSVTHINVHIKVYDANNVQLYESYEQRPTNAAGGSYFPNALFKFNLPNNVHPSRADHAKIYFELRGSNGVIGAPDPTYTGDNNALRVNTSAPFVREITLDLKR